MIFKKNVLKIIKKSERKEDLSVVLFCENRVYCYFKSIYEKKWLEFGDFYWIIVCKCYM